MNGPAPVLLVIIIILLYSSCTPKIYYFDVEPSAVGSLDSVRLHWKVRGEPMIMFDKVKMAVPEADSLQLLEFTLSVTMGTKEPAHRKKQVILLLEASKSLLYYMDIIKSKVLFFSDYDWVI